MTDCRPTGRFPFRTPLLFVRRRDSSLLGERTMLHRNEVPDKSLRQTINQRLDRTGTSSQTRFSAAVQRGIVTLSGILQYESQRSPIVRAVSNIAGVRHVIDQLRLGEKRTY